MSVDDRRFELSSIRTICCSDYSSGQHHDSNLSPIEADRSLSFPTSDFQDFHSNFRSERRVKLTRSNLIDCNFNYWSRMLFSALVDDDEGKSHFSNRTKDWALSHWCMRDQGSSSFFTTCGLSRSKNWNDFDPWWRNTPRTGPFDRRYLTERERIIIHLSQSSSTNWSMDEEEMKLRMNDVRGKAVEREMKGCRWIFSQT